MKVRSEKATTFMVGFLYIFFHVLKRQSVQQKKVPHLAYGSSDDLTDDNLERFIASFSVA